MRCMGYVIALTTTLVMFSMASEAEANVGKYYTDSSVIREIRDSSDRHGMLCLAMNIYHEGRGTSVKEQTAIAWSTINRTRSAKYPDTVCGVVFQKYDGRPQYIWTTSQKKIRDDRSWKIAQRIAYDAISGASMDPTGGAMSFCRDYVFERGKSRWCNKKRATRYAKIGSHYFIKIS